MIDKAVYSKRFGQRLYEVRKNKNLTQEALAHMCGKDKQSIGKVERGEFTPTIYYVYEIATALGVPVSELFEGIEA